MIFRTFIWRQYYSAPENNGPVALPSDSHWLAAQLRIIPLLDRSDSSIEEFGFGNEGFSSILCRCCARDAV
jgi:hypothetical protein